MTAYKNVTTVLQNITEHNFHTALPQDHQSSSFVLNYMSSFQNIQQHENEPLVRSVFSLKNYKTSLFTCFCYCIFISFFPLRAAASLPASFSHSISLFSCFLQLSSNNGSCFHIPFTSFPSEACQLWFLPSTVEA